MGTLWDAVEAAFQRLETQTGFERRAVQRQMAQFVCERLEGGESAMVEAPTGVGKSLAVLLPAIAYSLQHKKRIVISTYTNVLAEQYWRKDLPLALSLFHNAPAVALAMGRSRYACLDAIRGNRLQRVKPELVRYLREWVGVAEEGVEAELNAFLRRKGIPVNLMRSVWDAVAVPPACRAKACPYYYSCFYYEARRRAERAGIVITNHAFVLTDAIVRLSTNDAVSLLDEYDFLIVDEAHDLLDAAASTLEFVLDTHMIDSLVAHAATMSNQIADALVGENPPMGFLLTVQKLVEQFATRCRQEFARAQLPPLPDHGVATRVAPPELAQMPALRDAFRPDLHEPVAQLAHQLRTEIRTLVHELSQSFQQMRSLLTDRQREAAAETLAQFSYGFAQTYQHLSRLIDPSEGVSWVEPDAESWKACYAPLVLADWLRTHLWSRQPALLMSATLTVDGKFDFFEQQLGIDAPHQLRLPPVFDYRRQCALYLPPLGTIPSPPASGRAPGADEYYRRVAEHLATLLRLTEGRALVLFASRHEMHAVYQRMPELPYRILLQGESANADLSRRFREEVQSVLFGLRSFWTGFDAPGETLTNLILVRIPFEVPTTPLQRARQAWYESRGENAFTAWTLPMAKQLIRQGFGRLIRRSSDVGIVAFLDPRIRLKAYGTEILRNLPPEIPHFDSLQALSDWLQRNTSFSPSQGRTPAE